MPPKVPVFDPTEYAAKRREKLERAKELREQRQQIAAAQETGRVPPPLQRSLTSPVGTAGGTPNGVRKDGARSVGKSTNAKSHTPPVSGPLKSTPGPGPRSNSLASRTSPGLSRPKRLSGPLDDDAPSISVEDGESASWLTGADDARSSSHAALSTATSFPDGFSRPPSASVPASPRVPISSPRVPSPLPRPSPRRSLPGGDAAPSPVPPPVGLGAGDSPGLSGPQTDPPPGGWRAGAPAGTPSPGGALSRKKGLFSLSLGRLFRKSPAKSRAAPPEATSAPLEDPLPAEDGGPPSQEEQRQLATSNSPDVPAPSALPPADQRKAPAGGPAPRPPATAGGPAQSPRGTGRTAGSFPNSGQVLSPTGAQQSQFRASPGKHAPRQPDANSPPSSSETFSTAAAPAAGPAGSSGVRAGAPSGKQGLSGRGAPSSRGPPAHASGSRGGKPSAAAAGAGDGRPRAEAGGGALEAKEEPPRGKGAADGKGEKAPLPPAVLRGEQALSGAKKAADDRKRAPGAGVGGPPLAATPVGNRPAPGEGPPEDVELATCSDCGRRFRKEALGKHSSVCKKVFGTKRKEFNSTAARVVGTELEGFVQLNGALKPGRGGASSAAGAANGERKPGAKPVWKAQSESLQAAIRAARELQEAKAKGIDISSLPPPPPAENPDYVQCPTCKRTFAPSTAERHIPKCKARPKAPAAQANRRGISAAPMNRPTVKA